MKLLPLLIASVIMNVWFSFVVIRLEKFHYSTMVGLCSEQKIVQDTVIRQYDEFKMYQCLVNSEPRTSGWWNLIYGLKII